jgi:hypothetical protein
MSSLPEKAGAFDLVGGLDAVADLRVGAGAADGGGLGDFGGGGEGLPLTSEVEVMVCAAMAVARSAINSKACSAA